MAQLRAFPSLEIKVMTMKAGFRYFCFICASLLATQIFAQDMSGWSDKTVCRLVTARGGQEHIDEATKRGLDCAAPKTKTSSGKSNSAKANPLDALTIPDNWQLASNQAVFDYERSNIKDSGFGYSPRNRALGSSCFEIMSNYRENNLYLARNQNRLEKMSSVADNADDYFQPTVDTCLDYYAQLAGAKGTTPEDLKKLFLIWAKTNAFVFQSKATEQKLSQNYQIISALTVMAAYYAVYYDEFEYTPDERELVDNYLTKKLLSINTSRRTREGKPCNPKRVKSLARDQGNGNVDANTCGSLVWKATVSQLLFGLRLKDESVFRKGIENTKWQFNFFDDEGIFITWATKGASSMQYTGDLPTFLGLLTEIYNTLGYNLMEHQIPNGLTIKQVMDKQVDIHYDHMLLYKYASNVKNAYKGVDTKEFSSWDRDESLDLAGTSLHIMAREMARYIDTYRPELAHLRDLTYKRVDPRGRNIQIHGSFHAVEPYKIYLSNSSVESICKTIKCSKTLLKKFEALSVSAE
jgi:hypothetical protein